MVNKTFFSLFIVGLLLTLSFFVLPVSSKTITSSGTTLTVDDDGTADFTSIQDAINASSEGDTIFVYNGTYNENIVINKSITLEGEDNENTIINSEREYETIQINADNVSISCFKLFSDGYKNTILINNNNCKVKNNKLFGKASINVKNNYYNEIFNNIIYGSISIINSNNNEIVNNSFYHACRIYLDYSSSNNLITKNTIDQEVPGVGIMLGNSESSSVKNNVLSYNIVKNCRYGIEVNCANNIIIYNDFINNNANADVFFRGHCKWHHNYWGKSDRFPFDWKTRIPRPIISGRYSYTGFGYSIFIDLDLFPAKSPNCDFGGDI